MPARCWSGVRHGRAPVRGCSSKRASRDVPRQPKVRRRTARWSAPTSVVGTICHALWLLTPGARRGGTPGDLPATTSAHDVQNAGAVLAYDTKPRRMLADTHVDGGLVSARHPYVCPGPFMDAFLGRDPEASDQGRPRMSGAAVREGSNRAAPSPLAQIEARVESTSERRVNSASARQRFRPCPSRPCSRSRRKLAWPPSTPGLWLPGDGPPPRAPDGSTRWRCRSTPGAGPLPGSSAPSKLLSWADAACPSYIRSPVRSTSDSPSTTVARPSRRPRPRPASRPRRGSARKHAPRQLRPDRAPRREPREA